MDFTLSFLKIFFVGLHLCLPLLAFVSLIIFLLGQIVGKMEGWPRFDSFYWSFITATTIGYGDIRPELKITRLISILIGLCGFILTGMLVAIAVHAATVAFKEHVDPPPIETVISQKVG